MKLKKSLGQNFFSNPRLAEKIVEITLEQKPKSLLEIGPGDGYFTSLFAKKVERVLAIEKDSELAQMLKIKLPNVAVLNTDILELNLTDLKPVSSETVCFGSLPYNISKRIIAKFLEESDINQYYFIIQKEVAQKYIKTESDTSVLSIATKLYADCEVVMDIKPGAFIPAPKVTSCFIKLKRNNNLKRINDPATFMRLVKAAFLSPRKMLRNNLKGWEGIDSKYSEKRPGELSFNEYAEIANSM